MSDQNHCPTCRHALPADAPAGTCPHCLLAAGLDKTVSDPEEASGKHPTPPGQPEAPTPEQLADRFPTLEILELIGRGGMGIVYRARQKGLDREVALKILPEAQERDPSFAERFTREARTMARLDHANIVRIHESGEHDGLYYLVMEYIDGSNLRDVMRVGGLDPKQALAIVPQICDALQYAHDQGIVHRDIKPENVLMDKQGRVKLADFGLAKLMQKTAAEYTITGTNQIMGTLHYMAPEQYKSPLEVDHRADIYSLGVVFYEMLTGEVPMGRFEAPSKRVQLDVRLDQVVLRSLERERDLRYQQASHIKSAVTGIPLGPAPSGGVPPVIGGGAQAFRPAAAAAPPPPPPPPATAAPLEFQAPTNRVPAERVSKLAVAGGLGVPVALLFGAIAYGIVETFSVYPKHMNAAPQVAAMTAAITMGLGMILSIIAWIVVGSSNGRLSGMGWAIVGTFLPIPIACGGALVSVFLTRVPDAGFHTGPFGTNIRMPGFEIYEGPDGTRVRGPGFEITEDRNGTRVRAPGISITEGDPAPAPTGTIDERHAEVQGRWEEAIAVLGAPNLDALEGLVLPDDLQRLRDMDPKDRVARADAKELGILLHNPSQLVSPAEDYRVSSIFSSGSSSSPEKRVVMTSNEETLVFGMYRLEGKLYFSVASFRAQVGMPGREIDNLHEEVGVSKPKGR